MVVKSDFYVKSHIIQFVSVRSIKGFIKITPLTPATNHPLDSRLRLNIAVYMNLKTFL